MSFKVQISAGNQPVTLGKKFDDDDTVLSVKQYYYDTESNDHPVNTMNLYYNGQPMQNNKTLGYYDDDIDRIFICILTFRVGGGASLKNDEKESKEQFNAKKAKKAVNKVYKIGLKIPNRKRTLSAKAKKKLKTTKKVCTLYGDTPDINVIMSCGHVYCPDAVFDIVHNTLSKNRRNNKVVCPSCKKEWSFKEFSRAACLYDDEYEVIALAIQIRSAPETKNCPNCKAPNTKPDDLKMLRVACQCGKGDWCWFCNKKWIGGGFTVCGNNDCVSNEINNTLKNCPTKNLGASYGNIIVPIFRACPKCHQLIRHETACKHMNCRRCKFDFCFSCLKPKNADGKWPCKEYNFACPPAKRQILK